MKMEFNKQAKKDFDKLDNSIKKQIYKKLRYIESLENPRDDGKALKGNLFNFGVIEVVIIVLLHKY